MRRYDRHRPVLRRPVEPGLRAVVEGEPVSRAARGEAAAGAAPLVEHADAKPGIVEASRRGGPGHARPQDRNRALAHHPPLPGPP